MPCLISEHQNAFLGDPFLIRCLKRIIPNEIYSGQVESDQIQFGSAVSGPIWQLGRECEEQPPILKKSTPWGKVTDEIVTCQAWKEQKKISALEGLIAIAYERPLAQFSRVYQVAKLMLYSPASGTGSDLKLSIIYPSRVSFHLRIYLARNQKGIDDCRSSGIFKFPMEM